MMTFVDMELLITSLLCCCLGTNKDSLIVQCDD